MNSNMDIEFVFMTLEFEAYNEANLFTKEQREALVKAIENTKDLELNIMKPFSFIKNLKKMKQSIDDYEKLFKLFGGDMTRFESKLSEMRAKKLSAMGEMLTGR